ncbi:cell division topological specificity factor MinE [Acidisoma sp. 7E03]
MSFFSFLSRKPTANVARDRLQILLAHERATFGGNADLVAVLQEEILAVIAKHVSVEREKVQVKLDRGDSFSTLEIGVEIPPGLAEKQAGVKKAALGA